MTELNFNNYSKLTSKDDKGRRRFDWCVFVDEPESTLSEVQYVRYILHPTFPNPERISHSAKNKFAIFSNGWGTFEIDIEVKFWDGRIHYQDYTLKLEENGWPGLTPDADTLPQELTDVYKSIEESSFQWRKKGTVVKKLDNLSSVEVDTILGKLEDLNLIRKAPFQARDDDDLYGLTSKVGKNP